MLRIRLQTGHGSFFTLALLLAGMWAGPWTAVALAQDAAPVLPPPTEVQDSPAALETVEPRSESSGGGLRDELAAPGDQSNVEVYSYKRKDGTRVEEYSHQGRVYMVKISPPGGLPPYYLYDRSGNGRFERDLPGGRKHITPPEWVIKRF